MKKEKSATAGAMILLLVAMIVGVVIGLMCAQTWPSARHAQSSTASKIEEVLAQVGERYVDSVDIDSVSDMALAILLDELDPHSIYIPASKADKTLEQQDVGFYGTGLVLRHVDDSVYISSIVEGSPSAAYPFLPGDKIIAVDGWNTTGQNSDTVVARVRGPRGTVVELLTVRYPNDTMRTRLRRDIVPNYSIPYYGMLSDTVGYIRLTTFHRGSHDEFRHALSELMRQGMTHLVFDLRGNTGGVLAAAIGIAGELLPERSLIVYTEGLHSARSDVRTSGKGLFTHGRVSVLINEESASASEVVSGALQDNDRATIYGRRSFGKGLVQTEHTLSDGSLLLLTTARYYTPSGRCIQRNYDEGTEEYYRTYMKQLVEESYADSVRVTVYDSTPYYTLGGRVVYGGGGITPDVILTYRHHPTFTYYNALVGSGAVNQVAFDHVRLHAAQLLRDYPTADDFFHRYTVSEALMQRMVQRGEAAGVKRNAESYRAQKALLANLMKAYIGQCLYGNAMFYRVLCQTDDDLDKVLHS